MPALIPDQEKCIVCSCGCVSFALRGDGFCECHNCGKEGSYEWGTYERKEAQELINA